MYAVLYLFLSLKGWGKTSFHSSFSEFLREAKMPVVDYKTCAAGNINLFQKVDDKTMVCAGYGGNSVISGCHGDSGGPFVCQESGRWVLRGAVSWGDHWCRGGSTFSVFARISTFVDSPFTNNNVKHVLAFLTLKRGVFCLSMEPIISDIFPSQQALQHKRLVMQLLVIF